MTPKPPCPPRRTSTWTSTSHSHGVSAAGSSPRLWQAPSERAAPDACAVRGRARRRRDQANLPPPRRSTYGQKQGPIHMGPHHHKSPKGNAVQQTQTGRNPREEDHEQSTSNDAEDIRRAAGLWSHPRGRTPETIRAQRDGERQRSPTGCSDASHEQGGGGGVPKQVALTEAVGKVKDASKERASGEASLGNSSPLPPWPQRTPSGRGSPR